MSSENLDEWRPDPRDEPWKPDPREGERKLVLSEDVLRTDDEDELSSEEYTRRLRQARAAAREELTDVLQADGVDALRRVRDRLEGRVEEEKARVAECASLRHGARRAAWSAHVLLEEHGSEAPCGSHHFVVQGDYDHEVPQHAAPARWRRTEEALVALTHDGAEVLRRSTDATFADLRRHAMREYQRMKDSWRRRRKDYQFFRLRQITAENLLRSHELGYQPTPRGTDADEEKWTAQDATTERAVAVLSAYHDQAHELSKMKHLSKLLNARGYGRGRKTRNAFCDAARRHGVEWEDGNPHSFIAALASALDEVGELPQHLQGLKSPQDSCG